MIGESDERTFKLYENRMLLGLSAGAFFSLSSISFKKISGFGILTTLLAKDTLSQTNIISQTAIYDKENLQWPNACDLIFVCC